MTAAFVGCGKNEEVGKNEEDEEMLLHTPNDRLDSTEKQLSYRTDSMEQTKCDTAYENSWLTQTDLGYAMYYACGKVVTCKKSDWENKNEEAYKEIDFTPEEQCPAINEQVELDIKRHVYENHPVSEVTFEEFAQNFSFRYVGSYNGTFVVTDERTIYWDYATDVRPPQWIAGFVWSGFYDKDLFVFRYE